MNSEQYMTYRKTSYISRTIVGNTIVNNSDVVGASPVGETHTRGFTLTITNKAQQSIVRILQDIWSAHMEMLVILKHTLY